jgi:succinate-semialdehyde dehydrogenase / glutarate-semialdehyde dehydrogenase
MRITTIDPATEEVLQVYETMGRAGVEEIAARAHEAFLVWRDVPHAERAVRLTALAGVLRRRRDEYARTITLEMGKPITEAGAEVEKCAFLCEVYAEHAADWLREEVVAADGREHRVAFEPLGVILSIMPWNFPFWQALRFGVPALAAGNTSVLKHASNVPQCARAIEGAFREAGFPADAFRAVFADHESIAALIGGGIVRGVALTGSTAAGARIAEAAGRALKKVVLELGGSDPFLVLDDADVEIAAQRAVQGRMIATGQSCIAAKRFIVARPLAEEFTRRFAAKMAALVVGDPLDERTQVGPVVNEGALRELAAQLDDSVAAGARVVTGGARLPRRGYYFEPTVVAAVRPAMRVASEEVFGPIAPVLAVGDDDEAVALANASEYGLGGCVWTRDLARGARVARRLEAGTVFVNSVVKSDPRMPFGGVKRSGLGRELSHYGLREFVNVKGISVYDHA